MVKHNHSACEPDLKGRRKIDEGKKQRRIAYGPATGKEATALKWKPPPDGWVKVNCDAAFQVTQMWPVREALFETNRCCDPCSLALLVSLRVRGGGGESRSRWGQPLGGMGPATNGDRVRLLEHRI